MKQNFLKLAPLKKYLKHLGSDADMDWRTMFLAFVFGLIAVTITNIVGLVTLQREMEEVEIEISKDANLINTDTLTSVLSEYDAKAENLSILLRGGAVDPSDEAR